MILDEVKADVEVSGDMKTSGFKIRTTAKAFQILSSNIYTNKIEAVIREISCNAVDAHIAAKNENPFDVHLPTQIEPFFSVRDYGTGLSNEDVLEIYTTYFSSTKNNSNEYIGALGLGSKSPFAVSESFNVVSFFNGVKTIYSCYKDENGEPQIAVVESNKTDEPNGLLVKVQAKPSEISDYDLAAYKVFRWFENIPNINSKSLIQNINQFKESTTIENDDFIINDSITENLVLMGNVAYKLHHPNIPQGGIVIKCKIGEVSFDPGRERITNDDKTIDFLFKKYNSIISTIKYEIKEFLDSNATPYEKISKVAEWKSSLLYGVLCDNFFKNWARKDPICNNEKILLLKRDVYRIRTSKTLIEIPNIIDYIHKESIVWIKNPNEKDFLSDYFCGKVNQYLRSLDRKKVCIVVNDRQIKAFGITDITELPKKERASYGTRTKNTNKYHIIDGYKFSLFQRTDESKLPSGEKIFVSYKNNMPRTSNYCWDWIYRASKTLNKTIYAIHYSVVESKNFDKTGWISLNDYLERFKTKNPKKIVYTMNFDRFIADNIVSASKIEGVKYKKLLEEFTSLFKNKTYSKPEYDLVDHYETSNDLQSLFEKIINVHPIFRITSGNFNNLNEILKFYIAKGK